MSAPAKRPRRSSKVSLNRSDDAVANAKSNINSRKTPRNSEANDALRTFATETPYANLRQLAGIIQKPLTPSLAINNPPSAKRSARKTPTSRYPQSSTAQSQRATPNRRPAQASTPHALRAIQQRRAGPLPGRDRRRSGRGQKETPRDNLRNLSRLLAPTTQQFEPTPPSVQPVESTKTYKFLDDLEEDADPPRPRLSMPLDDDSPQAAPPRLSEPPIEEDEEVEVDGDTRVSIENPRNVASPQGRSRRSRGSFGSIRLSDRFADLNELGLDAESGLPIEESFDVPMFDDDPVEREVTENENMYDAEDQSISDNLPEPFVGQDDDEEDAAAEVDDGSDNLSLQGVDEGNNEPTFVFEVPPEQSEIAVGRSAAHSKTGAIPKPIVVDADKRPKTSRPKKEVKTSKFGTPCPSLPITTIKRMAANFAQSTSGRNAALSKDAIASISQASDWFFEQISDDLAAYAEHAGRETIGEADVLTLMRRQRQLTSNSTAFSLAQRFLPAELLHDIHMADKAKNRHKRKRLSAVEEEQSFED